jgi:hypothetical protein
MDKFIVPFLILLLSVFISRTLLDKANTKLDQDKKAALIDLFSGRRIWSFAWLMLIIVSFFLCMKFQWIDRFWSFTLYFIALFIYLFVNAYLTFVKLKSNGFPVFYINAYLWSTSIRAFGLVLFVALILS